MFIYYPWLSYGENDTFFEAQNNEDGDHKQI